MSYNSTSNEELSGNLNSKKLKKIINEEIGILEINEEKENSWMAKFLSSEWYEIEKARIQRFGDLPSLLEGFDKDPFIPQKRIKMSFMDISDASKPFSQRTYFDNPDYVLKTDMVEENEPNIDKKQLLDAVLRIIEKYKKKLHMLLEESRISLKNNQINEKKKKKQIGKFKKYWIFLDFFQSAYDNIFSATKAYKYSPTIKMVHHTIYLEIREIRYQFYMKEQI